MRSALEAAPLELEGSEGARHSSLLCFFFFPPPLFFFIFYFIFFYALPLPLSSMAKLLVSVPPFNHFAKVSSPFLQRVVCSLTESSKRLEEQEEEAPLQEADTGSPLFSFLFFFLSFFFFFFFFFYLSSLALALLLNYACFCRC